MEVILNRLLLKKNCPYINLVDVNQQKKDMVKIQFSDLLKILLKHEQLFLTFLIYYAMYI